MKRETWKTWRNEEDRRIELDQADLLMQMAEEEGALALAAAHSGQKAECLRLRARQSALENGARAMGISIPD